MSITDKNVFIVIHGGRGDLGENGVPKLNIYYIISKDKEFLTLGITKVRKIEILSCLFTGNRYWDEYTLSGNPGHILLSHHQTASS